MSLEFKKYFEYLKGSINLLILFLLLINFFLSFYCWNCYTIRAESGHILNAFPFSNRLMLNPYMGQMILLIPFLLVSKTLFAVRLAKSIFITLTTFFAYLLAKELFGKKEGILTILILLFMPFFTLFKFGEWPYVTFFAVTSTYFWFKFLKKPNTTRAALAGLFIGLGIYQKFEEVYVVISLFLSSLIFVKDIRKFFSEKMENPKRTLFVLFLLSLVWVPPFLLYNLENGFPSLRSIEDAFVKSESKDILFGFVHKYILDFGLRVEQLLKPLSPGRKIFSFAFFTGNALDQGPSLPLFVVLLPLFFSLLAMLLYNKKSELSFVVFILLLFSLNVFCPSRLRTIHMHVLTPFVAILIARSVFIFLEKTGKIGSFLLVVPLVIILVFNIFTYPNFYSRLSDPSWVNNDIPEHSRVHIKARRLFQNMYGSDNAFVAPYWGGRFIERWTNGICRREYLGHDRFRGTQCGNITQELDCSESTKLVLPYPNYLKNGSNIWNNDICKHPNLNQSACYYPYRYIMNQSSKGNINITNRSYIKDADNDRAYVILRLRC